jgi:hypothetical protein
MVEAEANLMRRMAEVTAQADQQFIRAQKIGAPKAIQDAAAETALQAGKALNIAVLRWLAGLR